MTDHDELHARALDAALAEAAGRAVAPDLAAAVAERVAGPRERRGVTSRWLTAALLLIGLGATWWIAAADTESRDGPSPTEVGGPSQGPDAPLPPQVTVRSPAEARRDVRNLRIEVIDPGTDFLEGIAALERLERLELVGPLDAARKPRPGPEPIEPALADDAFAPLANCPRLQTLVLGDLLGWGPVHVSSLRTVPGLQELLLATFMRRLDAAMGASVAALPSLSRLTIWQMWVEAPGLKALQEAPGLELLQLYEPAGIDREGMSAIAGIRSLRRLCLNGIDRRMNRASARAGMPASMDLLSPDFLRSLPDLEALDLSRNLVDARRVGALPRSVRTLRLQDCEGLDADVGRGVAGLPALQELTLSGRPEVGAEDALVEVLQGKLLSTLHLTDWPRGRVAAALARQQLLTSLDVLHQLPRRRPSPSDPDAQPFELAFVSELPHLEQLTLTVVGPTTPRFEMLEGIDPSPLTAAPRLRSLTLGNFSDETVARIRAVAPPRIRIQERW